MSRHLCADWVSRSISVNHVIARLFNFIQQKNARRRYFVIIFEIKFMFDETFTRLRQEVLSSKITCKPGETGLNGMKAFGVNLKAVHDLTDKLRGKRAAFEANGFLHELLMGHFRSRQRAAALSSHSLALVQGDYNLQRTPS